MLFFFGEILDPQKMKPFGDIQKNCAELSSKLNDARNMAQIYIECNNDFELVIQNTLAKMLGVEGLIITKEIKKSNTVCIITVDEGRVESLDAGYFYYPKLSVAFIGKTGVTLFSYSANTGKQAAMTADVAKRRAYSAMAAALENNFLAEFNKELNVR